MKSVIFIYEVYKYTINNSYIIFLYKFNKINLHEVCYVFIRSIKTSIHYFKKIFLIYLLKSNKLNSYIHK